ncbi:hypothetical protein J3U42_12200 [Gilliamella sp. B2923]|uniref:hypothetical protein n=1 Tax=Gilliamella sp. B2923 TaxID=2818005 RepID=UPI00226A6E79|nr:hypothetical protein [Gilliamella sp. B2923]MCX8619150.1 hypothetical protein [Gilliamella sp. B2923]
MTATTAPVIAELLYSSARTVPSITWCGGTASATAKHKLGHFKVSFILNIIGADSASIIEYLIGRR